MDILCYKNFQMHLHHLHGRMSKVQSINKNNINLYRLLYILRTRKRYNLLPNGGSEVYLTTTLNGDRKGGSILIVEATPFEVEQY